jgi:hypothetical protein
MKKLVKFLTKSYFYIKGIKNKIYLKKGNVYKTSNIFEDKDTITRYYYRGDNTFFITKKGIERTYGVEFFDSKLHRYTNRELGLLDFKMVNDCDIIT